MNGNIASKKKKMNDRAILQYILKITEDIHNITDIDILLDKLLFEARKFTNAEGGTIFLVEDETLNIKYTQNDKLFQNDPAKKYKYLGHKVTIGDESIAGCTAKRGQVIEFKDVYKRGKKSVCGFDKSFDIATGYRTKSVLSFPLKTIRNRVIGVLQLINAKDETGKVVPFSEKDGLFVSYLSNDAAVAIEKATATREMILRMLRMVEFRDPKETGGHVNRMGAYSVEIYGKWAEMRGFPQELIRRFKDKYRIAAMLHDAGKVGISDKILKKPGKLEEDELRIMKMHTILGYRLFANTNSEIDAMAAEVALNHHERWDGKGYPGKNVDILKVELIDPGQGKENIEIPITGRVVAVADVYDALISKRIYKDAWTEDKVLEYIKSNAGTHFDPEVVEAFFGIYDVITAIREKYTEEQDKPPLQPVSKQL